MENNKPKFRRRFKIPICKWLRFNNKIYTETAPEKEEEDNDWDNDNLINGNNPITVKRRLPIFQI